MKRFEIYQAALPIIKGSHIQSGCRPVLVISNDMANKFSPVVTVVPLTTRLGKKCLPTHVTLLTSGLRGVSLALCEQILTIDKARLGATSDMSATPTTRRRLTARWRFSLASRRRKQTASVSDADRWKTAGI